MGTSPSPIELTGHGLLTAWERGSMAHPTIRGSAVAALAWPEAPAPVEQLPVGMCDTILLAVHVGTFGATTSAVSSCPACEETADVEIDAGEILRSLPAPSLDETGPHVIEVAGREIRYRLPTSLDLFAAAEHADDDHPAREVLIERCLSADGDAPLAPAALEEISSRIVTEDPASDVRLRLVCPACGHQWSAPWPISAFVWDEIDAAAGGLLAEVDELASRYAWREADILAMTPARRRAYLDLG